MRYELGARTEFAETTKLSSNFSGSIDADGVLELDVIGIAGTHLIGGDPDSADGIRLNADGFIQISRDTTMTNRFRAVGSAEVQMQLERANGTHASPTAVTSSDSLGSIFWGGHDSSVYAVGKARIIGRANATWTTSSNPTRIELATTPTGSTTVAVRLTIQADGVVAAAGEMKIGGDLNHDGSNIGFFGVAPAAQASLYAPINVVTDRAYDANSTTVAELADVLGTLIADLQTYGLLT